MKTVATKPAPEHERPDPMPVIPPRETRSEYLQRQWRKVLAAKVVGVVTADLLVFVLVKDADTRRLFLLITAGIYLPLSLVLYAGQRHRPAPPTPAWCGITLLDIGVIGATQAVFPRLSVAFLGLTAIVMVSAVLLGIRWSLIVAAVSWACLLAATIFGDPGQPSPFSVVMAGLLLLGMAYLLGSLGEDERRAADRSRRLAEAIASVGSSLELGEVLETLCDAARQAMDARVAVVLAVESQYLRFGAGSGQPENFVQAEVVLADLLRNPALSESPTARAVRSMAPAPVEDVLTDETVSPWRDTAKALDFRSLVSVPVHRDGTAVGVLNVYLRRPHRFTSEETEFLIALAEHAGIAIDRARLFAHEKEAAERLRDLDRLKSDFVATVSHELRTPLTAIEGFALTLRQSWRQFPAEIRDELLERLEDNSRSLEHLITHLLDFGRLERGEFQVQLADEDVDELVDRILGNMVHELAGHALVSDVVPGLRVMADRYAFDRILGNLLSNAAKFSPPGSVIEVDAVRSGDEVQIAVRDRGPGIPPQDLEHVFDRFYRGVQRARGTGIGLAVVKDLVELHGGRVEVANAPVNGGGGALFTVYLPWSRPASEPGDVDMATTVPASRH